MFQILSALRGKGGGGQWKGGRVNLCRLEWLFACTLCASYAIIVLKSFEGPTTRGSGQTEPRSVLDRRKSPVSGRFNGFPSPGWMALCRARQTSSIHSQTRRKAAVEVEAALLARPPQVRPLRHLGQTLASFRHCCRGREMRRRRGANAGAQG